MHTKVKKTRNKTKRLKHQERKHIPCNPQTAVLNSSTTLIRIAQPFPSSVGDNTMRPFVEKTSAAAASEVGLDLTVKQFPTLSYC